MNKTISNLSNKGIHCSVADFHKYKVLDTVSTIIANNQMDLFMLKMKMTMFGMNSQKGSAHLAGTIKTSKMVEEAVKDKEKMKAD